MSKARIYQPAQTAMQSGMAKAKGWVIEFDRSAPISPESLMGWSQSEDTLNQVRLKFKSLEDAKSYAEEKGLQYIISPATESVLRPRSYADNFQYRPPEE